MRQIKYADELTENDYEIIKKINPKIYEQIIKRKNDFTFDELLVVFDEDEHFVFFDYVY